MSKIIKFKISGMHCASCATLIGQNLRSQAGVMNAKVDLASGEATVEFDEQNINKAEILEVIKLSGDYQIEEITVSEAPLKAVEIRAASVPMSVSTTLAGPFNNLTAKTLFIFGLLGGLAIVSVILNIFFGFLLYRDKTVAKVGSLVNTVQAANLGNRQAPSPSPSAPAPTAPAAVTDFTISKSDHVRGNFNAPVTLVEFSDFQCPYCARHYPILKNLLSAYPDKVRVVYKHFPLSFHENSQKAAEASECADEQGKFWEYHDTLFENQAGGFGADKFKSWAKDLGLNTEKFNACLDSGKYAAKVAADEQEGQSKGVQGTPATFVNGQLVSGAAPYESFKQIVDSLLIK